MPITHKEDTQSAAPPLTGWSITVDPVPGSPGFFTIRGGCKTTTVSGETVEWRHNGVAYRTSSLPSYSFSEGGEWAYRESKGVFQRTDSSGDSFPLSGLEMWRCQGLPYGEPMNEAYYWLKAPSGGKGFKSYVAPSAQSELRQLSGGRQFILTFTHLYRSPRDPDGQAYLVSPAADQGGGWMIAKVAPLGDDSLDRLLDWAGRWTEAGSWDNAAASSGDSPVRPYFTGAPGDEQAAESLLHKMEGAWVEMLVGSDGAVESIYGGYADKAHSCPVGALREGVEFVLLSFNAAPYCPSGRSDGEEEFTTGSVTWSDGSMQTVAGSYSMELPLAAWGSGSSMGIGMYISERLGGDMPSPAPSSPLALSSLIGGYLDGYTVSPSSASSPYGMWRWSSGVPSRDAPSSLPGLAASFGGYTDEAPPVPSVEIGESAVDAEYGNLSGRVVGWLEAAAACGFDAVRMRYESAGGDFLCNGKASVLSLKKARLYPPGLGDNPLDSLVGRLEFRSGGEWGNFIPGAAVTWHPAKKPVYIRLVNNSGDPAGTVYNTVAVAWTASGSRTIEDRADASQFDMDESCEWPYRLIKVNWYYVREGCTLYTTPSCTRTDKNGAVTRLPYTGVYLEPGTEPGIVAMTLYTQNYK